MKIKTATLRKSIESDPIDTLIFYKVKDRGMGEGHFASVELYWRYGLYKVPTAAGWRSAHALV
ncbi:MAG: hypothetical protein ACXW1W_15585 [Methylococcaceae bacterium]